MDFLNIVYERHRVAENYQKCYEVGQLILRNFYENLPDYDPSTGLGEIEAAFICNKLDFMKEAEKHVKNADAILRVTHGDNHPLVTKRWKTIREAIDAKKNGNKWKVWYGLKIKSSGFLTYFSSPKG